MNGTESYDVPAWNDVITGLRQRGIAARIETWSPGWWSLIVDCEDPNELVMIGSHATDADPQERQEASIDLEAGPQDQYLVYRQITGDVVIRVTDDHFTATTDLDELAALIRTVMAASTKEI